MSEVAQPITQKVSAYLDMYSNGMKGLNLTALRSAISLIESDGYKQIFVAGNGGSAAISNHLCCDFIKGTNCDGFMPIATTSLSCNIPVITAIANDIGYEDTISYQLDKLASVGDIVILISSSGNSPNIVKAALTARAMGVMVIGLTGFSGGKLKDLCDISLHIDVPNYGVVEDCHQSIMHIISQFILEKRKNNVDPKLS